MSRDNKTACFACHRDIGGGDRVKVQHGVGSDGGGLHAECWMRITSEPDWLRALIAEARRYATDGEYDPIERVRLVTMTLDRGTGRAK